MKLSRITPLLLAAAVAFTCGGTGLRNCAAQPADPNADPNQEAEIQTRGPIHEAFAEIVSYDPVPGIIVQKAPPALIEELAPDEKPDGDNVVWISGYWGWDEERNDFLWVSGVWRALPPGRQWIPGYWGNTGSGYQWTSGYWANAATTETEYLPAPPATMEVGPNIAAPSPDHIWAPGCWVWRDERYVWRPGYWVAGRSDWVWVPAHYVTAPRGCIYSDGYWDRSIRTRGVVFAPVYLRAEVYSRPHYNYAPRIAIDLSIFADQLFVRPRSHHYYFGDYYAASYQSEGFFASFSYVSERHGYDPFYSHERWEHRHERDWDRRVEEEFHYRRDHEDARPPRTYRIQNERHTTNITNMTTITNITNINTGRDARNFQIGGSLDDIYKRRGHSGKFKKLDQGERNHMSERARSIQDYRVERQKIEYGDHGGDKGDKGHGWKTNLPKSAFEGKKISAYQRGQGPPSRPDRERSGKGKGNDKGNDRGGHDSDSGDHGKGKGGGQSDHGKGNDKSDRGGQRDSGSDDHSKGKGGGQSDRGKGNDKSDHGGQESRDDHGKGGDKHDSGKKGSDDDGGGKGKHGKGNSKK